MKDFAKRIAFPDGASRFLRSPSIIKAIVGPEGDRSEFTVHKDLLCTASEFFANALKGEWKEAKEQKVVLPDDDPITFERYLNHLYCAETNPSEMEYDPQWDQVEAAELYVLAQKLLDGSTSVFALKYLRKELSENSSSRPSPSFVDAPQLKTIQIIYDETFHAKDPARQLIVSLFTEHGNSDYAKTILGAEEEALPVDFVHELAMSMLRKRPTKKQLETKNREIERLEDLLSARPASPSRQRFPSPPRPYEYDHRLGAPPRRGAPPHPGPGGCRCGILFPHNCPWNGRR